MTEVAIWSDGLSLSDLKKINGELYKTLVKVNLLISKTFYLRYNMPTSANCWMKSLNSGLPRKVARWRLWNLPATVGAQCTSNLEQVWIGLNWFVILSSPDVEVGKEGIEQLGELWLVMILRLRDPELKACTKILMSLKKGNISQHPWHYHLCIESQQLHGQQ